MDENSFQKKRYIDLSRMSFERGVYTFTDFLTLAEQSDLYECIGDLYSGFSVYGGFEGAERVMVRFGTAAELGYEQPFPISVIKITPLQAKFAEDLTHRDYLGSLMNLGIERHKLGDILISGTGKHTADAGAAKDTAAYVFAEEDIADYICREITRIRHTSVSAGIVDSASDIPALRLEECSLQVRSERIDAVIAKAYNLSRSQSAELFSDGKVYVNGRLMENESHTPRAGDIISVRGFGRFIYLSISGTTKKGNLYVTIRKYI